MAIPGEKAIQMVRSAHAQAAQLDIAVTAVVVDQSGRMIALGRMDRARPITVEIALNKAYTAASFQQPTKELTDVAGQTWFHSLVVSSNGRIMPGAGALPIVEGGGVVGAIAVFLLKFKFLIVFLLTKGKLLLLGLTKLSTLSSMLVFLGVDAAYWNELQMSQYQSPPVPMSTSTGSVDPLSKRRAALKPPP